MDKEMMTKQQLLALCFAATAVVANCCAAQPAVKHLPDFKLAISTDDETVKAQSKLMNIVVTAEETNISNHIVNVGRTNEPGQWYTMSVVFGGHPAPLTEEGQRVLNPKKVDPDEGESFSSFFATLKPGQAATFEVPLSQYFNFASPGTYQVTFSRGTDRGQPDNVDVKSNTITITVLPEDDPPPAKP
jgi:hypothetical protein